MCPSTGGSDLPFVFGTYTADVDREGFAPVIVEAEAEAEGVWDRSALHDSLIRLADSAVKAVRRAEGGSVSLVRGDRPVIVASTAPFVSQVSRLEVEAAEGPGVASVRTATTVLANSLDLDVRWPRFRARIAPLGALSALAVPLRTDKTIGVMTLYARNRDSFDADAARLINALAISTAEAVRNAQLLAQAEQLAAQLQAVIADRGVVDRAIGIMMSRNGGSEERAMALLQQMSDRQHEGLTVMAQQILDEAHGHAVRRYAQARLRPRAQPMT